MAVISVLRKDGKEIRKANNATLSEININGLNYKFGEFTESPDGVCENAVNDLLADIVVKGNSVEKVSIESIPKEYKEIESITSTGRSFIDTGILPTNSTSVHLTYRSKNADLGKSQYIMGSRALGSGSIEYAINGSSAMNSGIFRWDIRFNGLVVYENGIPRSLDRIETKIDLLDGEGTWTFTNLDTGYTSQTALSGVKVNAVNTLHLFAYNAENVHEHLEVFRCKIFEAGELVRDLIPCYRNSDLVAGLYDTINSVFYPSVGSKQFSIQEKELDYCGDVVHSKNLIDFSTTVPSSTTMNSEFRYNNGTGTLELISPPAHYDYLNVYLIRDGVGIELKKGTTYYYGGVVTVYGKKTNKQTIFGFGMSGESNTNYAVTKNGSMRIKGTFIYNGETEVRLKLFPNIGNNPEDNKEPAYVRFDYVYFSEVDEFVPFGFDYKIPISITQDGNVNNSGLFLKSPLRKFLDYADYTDFKRKKVIRKVGYIQFDGSEGWSVYNETGVGCKVFALETLKPLTGEPHANTSFTHFTLTSEGSTSNFTPNLYRFQGSGNNISGSRLYVSHNSASLQEFITWLSSVKPIFQYPINSEEDLGYGEILTFKGNNEVSVTPVVEPSETSLAYWKQI